MTDDIRISHRRHTYPPVGRCIYCGSKEALTDEHIIAYSLGGDVILPKASCRPCAAITANLEGVIGRPIFGPMRSYYEIQKRKRAEEYTVSMIFETEMGNEIRQISVKDAPPFLFLRPFDPPGILDGLAPSSLIRQGPPWIWYSHDFPAYAERFRRPGDKKNGRSIWRSMAVLLPASLPKFPMPRPRLSLE